MILIYKQLTPIGAIAHGLAFFRMGYYFQTASYILAPKPKII